LQFNGKNTINRILLIKLLHTTDINKKSEFNRAGSKRLRIQETARIVDKKYQ